MKSRLALVQAKVHANPKKNYTTALAFVKKAKSKGADIVVFPEFFVTGVEQTIKTDAAHEHEYVKWYQGLAKTFAIDILPGSVVHESGAKRFNASYYMDSAGKILGSYHKNHLWLSERKDLVPGKKSQVINTKHGKIGLLICWDLMFPESFRSLVKQGAEIALCPAFWCTDKILKDLPGYSIKTEQTLVNALCVERAFENELFVAYCNTAQSSGLTNISAGRSQVTAPIHGVLKRLDHNKEDMLIVDIDTTPLKKIERAYKIRKDLGMK